MWSAILPNVNGPSSIRSTVNGTLKYSSRIRKSSTMATESRPKPSLNRETSSVSSTPFKEEGSRFLIMLITSLQISDLLSNRRSPIMQTFVLSFIFAPFLQKSCMTITASRIFFLSRKVCRKNLYTEVFQSPSGPSPCRPLRAPLSVYCGSP